MATMGVLYDVLFKPIGRGDSSSSMTATAAASSAMTSTPIIGGAFDVPTTTTTTTTTTSGGDQTPPEWVLDERDGGSLVWRRYVHGPTASHGRRRVEFLDAVEVRVFERDDYCGSDADVDDDDEDDAAHDADAEDDADDGQLCWADDWCWDEWDDGAGGKKLFYRQAGGPGDYPVLVAVSVTVLGLCFGLAYLFAPVRWLFHQLILD